MATVDTKAGRPGGSKKDGKRAERAEKRQALKLKVGAAMKKLEQSGMTFTEAAARVGEQEGHGKTWVYGILRDKHKTKDGPKRKLAKKRAKAPKRWRNALTERAPARASNGTSPNYEARIAEGTDLILRGRKILDEVDREIAAARKHYEAAIRAAVNGRGRKKK